MKDSILKYWNVYYSSLLLGILCAVCIYSNVIQGPENNLAYQFQDSLHISKILASGNGYEIYENKTVLLKNMSAFDKFIAPQPSSFFYDNIHLLFLMTCSIVVFFIRKREVDHGTFNARLSKMTGILSYIAIAFLLILVARDSYFNDKIQGLLFNQYGKILKADLFAKPEFFAFIILGPISYLLKKGEELQIQKDNLQQDKDLTI